MPDDMVVRKLEWHKICEGEKPEASDFSVAEIAESARKRVKKVESVKKLNILRKSFLHLKLEEENQRSLSLDPRHHSQIFNATQEEEAEEEEEEEEKPNFYGGLEAEARPRHTRASKKRSSDASFDYARQLVDLQREAATTSKMGIRGSRGEIVEVQGGHIVRSIGRKDRHSKVCTAKGPRDRRVRLSAHTAIQFYDVQDRLGCDRPSKAVDWLIKKAKTAIDELEELPAWKPNPLNSIPLQQRTKCLTQEGENTDGPQPSNSLRSPMGRGGRNALQHLQFLPMGETTHNNTSSFLPPSLDSDSIADTIKSFFPMGATTSPEMPSSTIQFQSYPPAGDLRLSLQCFKHPLLLHHQSQQQNHHNEHVFFSGASSLPVLDGITPAHWGELGNTAHPPLEIGRFQRMVSWSASGAETGTGSDQHGAGNGSFIINLPPYPPPPPLLQPLFGETQLFSQRGPLQSSNTPMFHAWIDPSSTPSTNHQITSSFSGYELDSCGLPGFRIPARIQGLEEHDGISDKLSSASSNSRH